MAGETEDSGGESEETKRLVTVQEIFRDNVSYYQTETRTGGSIQQVQMGWAAVCSMALVKLFCSTNWVELSSHVVCKAYCIGLRNVVILHHVNFFKVCRLPKVLGPSFTLWGNFEKNFLKINPVNFISDRTVNYSAEGRILIT